MKYACGVIMHILMCVLMHAYVCFDASWSCNFVNQYACGGLIHMVMQLAHSSHDISAL